MSNQLIRTAGVTLCLVLSTLASSRAIGAQTTNPRAEAEFKALIERYYAAWNTLNAESPASYYAKDTDLVFYDIRPLKYNGWAEYQEGVKRNFFDLISGGELTPRNDLKVTVRGRVAWTTLTFRFTATLKAGGAIDLVARHTAIWEKRAGKWMIVHEHVSAPLPG